MKVWLLIQVVEEPMINRSVVIAACKTEELAWDQIAKLDPVGGKIWRVAEYDPDEVGEVNE